MTKKSTLGYDINYYVEEKIKLKIMANTEVKETKDQIMSAFNKVLTEYRTLESKVETKEEGVEKEKNKALLTKVEQYTVDNIVNSMAVLQLDFSNLTKEIATRLTNESEILAELKKAIKVETERLDQLKNIRLVADALYILRQEHQERLKHLENQTQEIKENIAKEQEKYRKNWAKEQANFDIKIAEETELITKQREQEEADFNYQLEVNRKREMDEYEETKRNQERELRLANQEKTKGWQEREAKLKAEDKEFKENQQKISGFEEQIKTETNKARGEAIKEAEREAQIKANLLEKEWESAKQGSEFKIQSLEATIAKQTEQITEIMNQLQTATTQAQNLALRAFNNSDNQK